MRFQLLKQHFRSDGHFPRLRPVFFRHLRSPLVKILKKQTPKQNLRVVVVIVDVVDGSVPQQYRRHNINRLTV